MSSFWTGKDDWSEKTILLFRHCLRVYRWYRVAQAYACQSVGSSLQVCDTTARRPSASATPRHSPPTQSVLCYAWRCFKTIPETSGLDHNVVSSRSGKLNVRKPQNNADVNILVLLRLLRPFVLICDFWKSSLNFCIFIISLVSNRFKTFKRKNITKTLNFMKIETVLNWVQWCLHNVNPKSCCVSFGGYCIWNKHP